MCTVDYSTTCMVTHQQSTYTQLSPLYLLSILYVTHDKLFQAIYCFFCTASDGKLGRALEQGITNTIIRKYSTILIRPYVQWR